MFGCVSGIILSTFAFVCLGVALKRLNTFKRKRMQCNNGVCSNCEKGKWQVFYHSHDNTIGYKCQECGTIIWVKE